MKKQSVGVAIALVMIAAPLALAQTKTIPGEMRTEKATVEAIEASTRTLTLKKPDGTYATVVAPPSIQRFSDIKVGDTITARYYENIVLQVKRPGEAPTDSASAALSRSTGATPAGTAATQRTITAEITDIDQKVPSITFTGPNGWKYSSRVQDKAALAKVKVGDKVEITWTEAMLISAESTPKK